MATKAVSPSQPVAELDIVRLREPVSTEEGVVPAGAEGTVVHVHQLGAAFEIEFDWPFAVVATVMADAVERAPA